MWLLPERVTHLATITASMADTAQYMSLDDYAISDAPLENILKSAINIGATHIYLTLATGEATNEVDHQNWASCNMDHQNMYERRYDLFAAKGIPHMRPEWCG